METHAYCNVLVIAITCLVTYLGFRDAAFEQKYIFWPEAILAWKQYYRLITSGFLHLNGYHLLMNMMSLFFFGPSIETVYGPAQFLGIYLGSMIGGDLLSLYVHRHHDYRALGASGGVAGIMFAYIFLFPGGSLGMYFMPFAIPSWLYAIGYLVASFHGMQRSLSNVGHDAHLGGALTGLFIAAALHPAAFRFNPGLYAAILAATILLIFYLWKNPLMLPLEGIDFTKPREPGRSTSWSWRNLFRFGRRTSRAAPATIRQAERQMDGILQKISTQGIESLTPAEKELLNSMSEKYRQRAERKNPEHGFPF
jgi:membrane associated rhomboid family serine protease